MVNESARNVLASQIATILEIGEQYVEHVDVGDTEHIALIRSAGRKAGRLLGWKVRTFQSDPAKRDDHKVVVIVVVEESTDEDAKRFRTNSDLLIRDAMDNWLKP